MHLMYNYSIYPLFLIIDIYFTIRISIFKILRGMGLCRYPGNNLVFDTKNN